MKPEQWTDFQNLNRFSNSLSSHHIPLSVVPQCYCLGLCNKTEQKKVCVHQFEVKDKDV